MFFYLFVLLIAFIQRYFPHVILHEWIVVLCFFWCVFCFALARFWVIIHRSGVLTALAWLVPPETAAVSVRSVYTLQPCHFMQSHIRKVLCQIQLPEAKSPDRLHEQQLLKTTPAVWKAISVNSMPPLFEWQNTISQSASVYETHLTEHD